MSQRAQQEVVRGTSEGEGMTPKEAERGYAEIPLSQGKVALVDWIDYERVSCFKWSASKNQRTFYACRSHQKKTSIMLHRFILGLDPGDGRIADHINGDGLDNRRCNLRIVSAAQNLQNARRPVTNTTGLKGVSYHQRGKCFTARIKTQGKTLWLGSFSTAEEAHDAYKSAAREKFGEFARFE